MTNTAADIRDGWQHQSDAMIRELSEKFMALQTSLKAGNADPGQLKALESLFKSVLHFSQTASAQINQLLEDLEKQSAEIEKSHLEKSRLETLYASGIRFSSQTEKDSLLQSAMDTVSKALDAETGYILLVDEAANISMAFGRNLDPEAELKARDLSTTVIQNAISALQPVQVNDATADAALARQSSILYLDIKSVLCVPLMIGKRVMGAVYLDRRQDTAPFSENDLSFLIAFARQIVSGLQVSEQLQDLENRLISDATQTLEQLREKFHCREIIGSSREIFEMLRVASRIAATTAPVIILGESGTGKELIARAIHHNSNRPASRFVAINCGAIPADLLESELFGYEKGAFTGATGSKPGKLEVADGGTVFLDEIAEMDISLQAKLLRVLQSNELERIGSLRPKKINIRILAATNKNIEAMIAEGKFREDLYYRLKVIEITVPPLRQRSEDIEELAQAFLEKFADGKSFTLGKGVLSALSQYNWPGNIRELENVIRRCVLLAGSTTIALGDLPPEIVSDMDMGDAADDNTLWAAEQRFRKKFVARVLQQTSSKSEAAKILGVNRTYLYKLIEELGLKTD